MSELEDSLFSLELVVEKVYIPHTPCRFPAVAFRLLDFPTILIKHVEDDLGTAIRNKISFDPYYRMPDQFSELKDKHGNFMVKKGKSCLFKMSVNLLKQHLSNTPLYVMVIDMFPEVPKLVGNSTVPLNSLMDSICVDIANLGSTVPSVHGDKGLFKLYNLMGKEMGYFVLGFRLLCLGPSLIPHLPESALVHRRASGKHVEKAADEMLQNSLKDTTEDENGPNIELRNSACMTDPVKCDAILQTMEMEDKAVHVMVSEVKQETNCKSITEKQSHTMATQTEKRKRVKEAINSKKKWLDIETVAEIDHENDIIMSNIVCPPPLFYNSEAAPPIEIESSKDTSGASSGICVEDLSDIDSFDGEGIKSCHPESQESQEVKAVSMKHPPGSEAHSHNRHIPISRKGEHVAGLQVAPQPEAVFPLLTALINELACVQSPQFLLDVSNKMQAAKFQPKKAPVTNGESNSKTENISPSVVSAVAAALVKKGEFANEKGIKREMSVVGKEKPPSLSKTAVKDKSEDKASKPIQPTMSKTKLVYKLTTTQRLRLQKTNPQWLEKTEREVALDRAAKQPQHQAKSEAVDMDVTNFSDTLTEVRRLAEMELNSTAGGDTLHYVASEVDGMDSTLEKSSYKLKKSPILKKEQKTGNILTRNRKSPSPKVKSRLRQRRTEQHKNFNKDSSDSDELIKRKRPVPLERHISGITSPAPQDTDHNDGGFEEPLSARSDLPSSRSRSIEVHLPSAEPKGHDDSGTISDAEDSQHEGVAANVSDDDVDIPLPDDSTAEKPQVQVLNFPRYISREDSLPETIAGAANASLNASGTLNEDSPLESTRHSHNAGISERNDSRVLHHSTDLDTRQFHSTDEPELQDLVSEADNHSHTGDAGRHSSYNTETTGMASKFPVINPQLSENSPVPSVRRSTSKLDPGTGHSYLPSMSMSKGYTSPVSSRPGTPKSNAPKGNRFDQQPLHGKGNTVTTPRSKLTPRSPKYPTARPRRPLRESIHTDSLSSYLPSDPDNVLVSLSSSNKSGLSGGNYSDDFYSGESADGASAVELPNIIPNAKLGFTIN